MKTRAWAIGCAALLAAAAGTETAAPETGDAVSVSAAKTALDRMLGDSPGLRKTLDAAAAYAIFPNVGKAAVGIGGAYGKGLVYQHRQAIGRAELKQASIGPEAGAESYSELLVLQDRATLERFRKGGFDLGADASAVMIRSGAAVETRFDHGVAVFIQHQKGLLAGAAVSGQIVDFEPTGRGR